MSDAYIVALTLLSARELSESQIRARLKRREIPESEADEAISRLKRDGTLNDKRVALAIARMESAIKHRGRTRVLQKIRQAGIDGDLAEEAVREVFEEVNEGELLDRAMERRLRGAEVADLDDRSRARIARGLAGQGFSLDAIFKRLGNRRR